jgi:putative two-component system response regulator
VVERLTNLRLATDRAAAPREPALLIVDDEPFIRSLIARWLTTQGYRCIEAGNAEDAWTFLQRRAMSLMTLDISLSGQSGLELLPKVKASFPDTEVIMLTALRQAETAITALTRGASAYLIKPIAPDELLVQVEKALDHRHLVIDKRLYTKQLEARVREQTLAIRHAHEETIHRLVTASMYRDAKTGAHIRRVGMYAAVMAEALGWAGDDVELIRMAAPMHDIGKIGIPDAILQKPGPLTPEEFEIMKHHTVIGAELLAGSKSPVLELGRTIALNHHERWDGGGYPNGLAAEDIPESSRIVAIVDVYDALTHDRVYRPAFPEHEAIEIMENGHGTHFDPGLLRLFLAVLPEMRRIGREMPDELSQAKGLREMLQWPGCDVTGSMTTRNPSAPSVAVNV